METVIEPRDEIEVSGKVPAGTDSVSVNGYRLKSFGPGSATFLYRANSSIGNLKAGSNAYQVTFEGAGKTLASETVTVDMLASAADRSAKEAQLHPVASTPAATSSGSTGSGAESKYGALDANGFYTKDGAALSVTLRTISLTDEIEATTEAIQKFFQAQGIQVKLESVDGTAEAIQANEKGDAKTYDLIVTGVHFGFLGTYLFPHFHSGQAENGYNFSQIRDPNLDVLLESLRSNDLPADQLASTKEKILAILRDQAVFAPLYALRNWYFVDKGVKGETSAAMLPSSVYLYDLLGDSYIKESRIIPSGKSAAGFADWFRTRLESIFPSA